MTTKEYLPVSREDERYCDGCHCFVLGYCRALNTITIQATPPNCPLVKDNDIICRDCYE